MVVHIFVILFDTLTNIDWSNTLLTAAFSLSIMPVAVGGTTVCALAANDPPFCHALLT